MSLLVVTAVEAERDAVLEGAGDGDADIVAVGVGMATAAANTAIALVRGSYRAVVCAGIAGGFTGRAAIGDIVVATRSVAADLGADAPAGFITIDDLGFGQSACQNDGFLRALLLAALTDARSGCVLSVNTVTGTADGAARLAARHQDAIAEAMEGYGSASAASALGVPFVEVRTISNVVGPRDRDGWRIREALAGLRTLGQALGKLAL